MGGRGPVPKRSAERRRRNTEGQTEKTRRSGVVRPPAAPVALHEVARRWYESLADSGQSDYFEPSDWAAAVFVAETMTKLLSARRLSAPLFAAVWSAMNDLLTTEQSRRRARIEVERALDDEQAKTPGITAIAEYRKMVSG